MANVRAKEGERTAISRAVELACTGPYAEQGGLARLWVEEDLGLLAPGRQGRVERQEGQQ